LPGWRGGRRRSYVTGQPAEFQQWGSTPASGRWRRPRGRHLARNGQERWELFRASDFSVRARRGQVTTVAAQRVLPVFLPAAEQMGEGKKKRRNPWESGRKTRNHSKAGRGMIVRGIEDRTIIPLPIIPLTAFEEFSRNDAMSRDDTAESGAVRARSVQPKKRSCNHETHEMTRNQKQVAGLVVCLAGKLRSRCTAPFFRRYFVCFVVHLTRNSGQFRSSESMGILKENQESPQNRQGNDCQGN
jgi:hypothetical protein